MSEDAPRFSPVPGSEILGCGISPYEGADLDLGLKGLKRRIFEFDYRGDDRPYQGPDKAGYVDIEGTRHSVPRGVLVTTAFSVGSAETIEAESREQFENKTAASVGVKGGFGLFSASFDGHFSVDRTGSKAFHYFRRSQSVSLFQAKLFGDGEDKTAAADRFARLQAIRDAATEDFRSDLDRLAGKALDDDTAADFDRFFSRYGTHVIAGIAAGGQANIWTSVEINDETMTLDISVHVSAKYGSLFRADASATQSESYKTFDKNSSTKTTLMGGDTTLSGSMATDPAAFDKWAETVKSQPNVIHYGLVEIWELAEPGQQEAMKAALRDFCFRRSQYSVKYSGEGAFVDINGQTNLNDFVDLAIEAWIYPTENNVDWLIVNKEDVFEVMRKHSDGLIYFAFWRENEDKWKWEKVDNSFSIPLNAWTHVAVVYNSKDSEVVGYKNGNRIGAVGFGGKLRMLDHFKLRLGGRPKANQHFAGYMNEVRIWNAARTGAEIGEAMYRRLRGPQPGLVGLWPLNDGADRAEDRSGSGNDGVLRGTVWAAPPEPSPIYQTEAGKLAAIAAQVAAEAA